MAKVLVTEDYLSAIGNAIRGKLGGSTQYTPGQMASAISRIPTVAPTLISKSVVANGTYNASSDEADGYDSVSVNVPNSYASEDEGKVVNNGALVAQESQSISQNGTYNTTLKNQVVVSVPNTYEVSDNGKVVVNQALVAQTSKNINMNGTHDTTANNSVVVDVPNSYTASDEGKVVSSGALVAQESKNISQNGTYNTTLNNEVVVNVSGGGGVELLTRAEWDALSVAQKQAKGLVAILDYSTGFKRGELVNGTDYIPYNAIRIWSKSTGGFDAALYIQRGSYKNGTFVSDDDIYSLVYTQVQSSPIEYFSVISIQYSNGWRLNATSDVEYDNTSYTAGQTIKSWAYNTNVDFVVLADVSDE